MLYSREEVEQRARLYCTECGIHVAERLGFGAQGTVYSTDRDSARAGFRD
jgi:hypothetical protein